MSVIVKARSASHRRQQQVTVIEHPVEHDQIAKLHDLDRRTSLSLPACSGRETNRAPGSASRPATVLRRSRRHKYWPSARTGLLPGPDIENSGMKAHTMMSVEKNRARSISYDASMIRSISGRVRSAFFARDVPEHVFDDDHRAVDDDAEIDRADREQVGRLSLEIHD